MKIFMNQNILFGCALFALILFFGGSPASSQVLIKESENSQSLSTKRQNGLQMLEDIKGIIKQYYYDPNFNGMNLNERFKAAKESIKTAENNAQIFRTIAQILLEFNDSHTKFYPPARATRVEYGFSMQAIGGNCYVTDIKKGSDAETKNLKAGDQVTDIEGLPLNRANLNLVQYVIYHLDPRETISMTAKGSDGKEKKLAIRAKLTTVKDRKNERENRKKQIENSPYKCSALNSELIACKLYTFVIENKNLDKMMQQVAPYKKLILDLRGNGGGYLKALGHLTGYFFEKDIKLGDEKLRDKTKELIAKTQKEKAYKGELVVLVDSDSASASEIFSGAIQLEKRGMIIGDVTAGAVMASYNIPMSTYRNQADNDILSFYGVSVTIADYLLRDGRRLEGVGVIPDKLVGPAADALLKKYDPVLSYAALNFGVEITQEKAGELYFMVDKPEQDAQEGEGQKEEN
jgi:C-terminal peptidase prc